VKTLACWTGIVLTAAALAAGPVKPLAFTTPVSATRQDGKLLIEFALSRPADVEVSVLDGKGEVVRHLAAGMLGGAGAPPAPLQAGLAQRLHWDGRNDRGQAVSDPAGCAVRVRVGMGVRIERIVGGDPYAYWSPLSGQGDHAQWKLAGLEAKADGRVYVLGHTTFYGHPALRQYDARGNYVRTLFPPPAGRAAEDVAGWGLNVRPDGTYTLRACYGWNSAVPNRPPLCGGGGGGGTWCGLLMPTPDSDSLCVMTPPRVGNTRMTVAADGTLRKVEPGPVLESEALPKRLTGPFYSAFAPDGKFQYVSGVCAADEKGRPLTTGPWRDGQVWKVDAATRKASPFFALDETNSTAGREAIGDSGPNPYAALQGLTVDAEGRVFVCDRQNQRVIVLDPRGQILRAIPVANPDAVAVHPKSRTLYVTTRFGNYCGNGELKLLKLADWSRDDAPAQALSLTGGVGKFPGCSRLAVAQDRGEVLVWAAYVTLPARVYRDTQAGLELVKDFFQAGGQRALDLRHMMLDPKTGDAYVSDGHGFLFRVSDWRNPKFELCMQDDKTRLSASSIAIDAVSRHLYTHFHWKNGVFRWAMDAGRFAPAPVGQHGHQVTQQITCSWIFTGLGERGMAAGPGGGLATLGVVPDKQNRADDYSGPLHYFRPDAARAPWQPLRFKKFGGARTNSGGIRFDLRGNLYVGLRDGQAAQPPPPGFEKDRDFASSTGRIYKYAPTGSIEGGDLFPTEPAAPAKVYDVLYGPLAPESKTPRFGVDGWGRIYYPTGLLPRVSVMDNEGNAVLAFGTYGNRDSTGGLEGDLVPTGDVPLGWPNSVDASDDFVCVSDILNVRLLRLAKTFALTATIGVK